MCILQRLYDRHDGFLKTASSGQWLYTKSDNPIIFMVFPLDKLNNTFCCSMPKASAFCGFLYIR